MNWSISPLPRLLLPLRVERDILQVQDQGVKSSSLQLWVSNIVSSILNQGYLGDHVIIDRAYGIGNTVDVDLSNNVGELHPLVHSKDVCTSHTRPNDVTFDGF